MIKADELLKLIENVDVNDINALDKIDIKSSLFLNNFNLDIVNVFRSFESYWVRYKDTESQCELVKEVTGCKQYTRSRDALKSIRPDGWQLTVDELNEEHWKFSLALLNPENGNEIVDMQTAQYTEELAELHAIIQAIEWKRNND